MNSTKDIRTEISDNHYDFIRANNDLEVSQSIIDIYHNKIYCALYSDGNEFWGNSMMEEEYTSYFRQFIQSNPLVSGNLGGIENAVIKDISFIKEVFTVTASIIAVNRLKLTIDISEINVNFAYVINI